MSLEASLDCAQNWFRTSKAKSGGEEVGFKPFMEDIDHITIISNLTTEEREALQEQTDSHGLRHFSLHAGAIVLCGFLIAIKVLFWWALMLVQGVLICFLFTTLHETVHQTPFKTSALNIWVGRICGFMTFLGPQWFRYFHFAHHRYTHDPDRDPELASPKPSTTWQYLCYLSGIPETFERFKTLMRNALWANEDIYVPRRGKEKVMLEARVQLGLYGATALLSLLFWSPVVLYAWLIPFLLGAPFLRGYLLAEHTGCPHTSSMLENTRTVFTNRIIRFLAWNMPYHAEHHAYPSVPFHKLPAFHEHTRNHIKSLENGYFRFNRSYYRSQQSNGVADNDISN